MILNTPIEFKGSNFALLVVYLYNADPEVVRQALLDKIIQAPMFFKQAPVVINISNLVSPVCWEYLKQSIIGTGLRVVGISGCKDPELKSEILQSGLPILQEREEKNSFFFTKKKEDVIKITKTRFIDTPVRSGKCIYAPNCDLIVTNYVNSGAEIIADGNIHVYGTLRGRALAGANGDREAQIFCTNLSAELVSIAGKYWISEQIHSKFYSKAIRLRLVNDILTIQLLT